MQTLKGDDVVEPLLHLLQNRLANGPKGLIFGDVCALTPYQGVYIIRWDFNEVFWFHVADRINLPLDGARIR
jgi:hypothetical protein